MQLHDCDNRKEEMEEQISPFDYMKVIHFFQHQPSHILW